MPENWRSYPIRELAANAPQSFTDGDWIEAPHIRETGIRLIQTGNIGIGSFIDRSRKYISQVSFDALHCKEVRTGDLLICRLAEPIGRACFAPDLAERMITSVDVTILRVDTESFDPRFVSFCINTPECLRQCETVSGGTTRQRISRTNLGKVEITAPNVGVQRLIAEILSTLDEAIEQTEALIAKHQQIKAGLMHDLFTRGVTPDGHLRPTREQAPDLYKESPLGWIPREWEARPLRDLTIKIADRDHTTPAYVDDGVIMVSPTNILDDEGIDFAACRNIPLRDHLINRKKTDIESGDLILHRIGAGLGAVRLVTGDMPEFSILHSMALVRPLRSAVSAEYLLCSFRSYPVLLQMDIGTQSIGVPDLGLDKIGSLLFPVAPHGEQTMIANSLRTQTEAGSAERNRLIKLRQQKHGLMHDLLTGRVRVQIAANGKDNASAPSWPTPA